MAKFRFTALALDGTRVVGLEDAESLGDIHTLLADRELLPIEVAPKKSIFQYEITKKKVKPRDLMHFSRQLGVFLKAGIPISVRKSTLLMSQALASRVMLRAWA